MLPEIDLPSQASFIYPSVPNFQPAASSRESEDHDAFSSGESVTSRKESNLAEDACEVIISPDEYALLACCI
jgi:hypothetical protein